MLIEINLLPDKIQKKKAPLYVMVVLMLISLFIFMGVFLFSKSMQKEIAAKDAQLQTVESYREQLEGQLSTFQTSDSVRQLEDAVKWAAWYPLDTVPVMNHLISLLPKRGFFQEFSYQEDGTISLNVQFDSSREAAYYLSDLKQSNWISSATLNQLSTTEVSPEKSIMDDTTLPRYYGEYEIKINRLFVQNELTKRVQGGEEE
ncbi:PilN domain-containing protein [Bacillus sp. 2205SS5-2]|uniref:PilN domain-containing protein n=1 Tax=Bacillus sp. 2205SS5-2 TaxID=3109031 RepID=UPI003007BF2C